MGATGSRRVARGVVHASALLVTAWSLIATSAPDPVSVPVRDCFTGITAPTGLVATLAGDSDAGTGSDRPSCNGIDGLVPGSMVVLDLTQGDRPKSPDTNVCFAYATTQFEGASGVTFTPPDLSNTSAYAATWLADAFGTFASPTQTACGGTWSLTLQPVDPVASGTTIAPLDAGTGPGAGAWVAVRSIGLTQAQFCGDAFAVRGPVDCEDDFVVTSISESSAP